MKKIILLLSISGILFAADNLIVESVHRGSNLKFLKMKVKVAKEMGINLELNYNSCIRTQKVEDEAVKRNIQNQKSKKYYNEKLGKDWEKKLNEETKKRLNYI